MLLRIFDERKKITAENYDYKLKFIKTILPDHIFARFSAISEE